MRVRGAGILGLWLAAAWLAAGVPCPVGGAPGDPVLHPAAHAVQDGGHCGRSAPSRTLRPACPCGCDAAVPVAAGGGIGSALPSRAPLPPTVTHPAHPPRAPQRALEHALAPPDPVPIGA